ncbi:MAG TPA: TonB-dependent receptor [Bacteroidia bacterium]|nr:TonB-dependent receptor [Bacteroidia bacterium]
MKSKSGIQLFLFFALISFPFASAFSQTGTIRGFVYSTETGEPVLFTNVYLEGTTFGAATDVNGYYSITKVPVGDYNMMVTSIEHDTLKTAVSLKAGEIVTKKLYLTKRTVNLKTIDISAEKQEQRTEVKMSVNKITPKEIKQLPSVGGEPDIVQYLQVLPGVVFSGDQGGQLYIRGGTPIQNKVMLDGMTIYNPFHSIGLFSVFDTDIIRNADVYAGGFGAEYGGRISSIMDIKTRDGNKKRLAGKVSANTFTSKLLLEGPLKKAKKEGDGDISFVLSGKTSYLDKSSKAFYSYVDEDGLPYSFNDFYGKIVTNNAGGSKLNVFGFSFNDKAKYRDVSDYKWNSNGFGTSFVVVPGNSSVLMDGNFAYSQYKITLSEADARPRSSLVNGFNLALNFTYFIKKDELKYGLEVLGFKTDFEYYNFLGTKIEQEENTTELAAFLNYKKVWDKLVIEPGMRFHYYASLSELSLEPRLGAKYNLSNSIRLKVAGGMYSQNMISTVSDRDVVNLFYGFLSGPENLPESYRGEEVTSRLQKATHAIAGVELDLPLHLSMNIEAYWKEFNQLSNINRDKLFDDVAAYSNEPEILRSDYIVEEGTAKGIDVTLKYELKRIYFWAVYSLGYVTRRDEIREYVPHFDRRHNVNLVGSYTFGKKLNWQFDARWNMGSGFPFTQTQGFYEYLNFTGGLNVDPKDDNGELGILYGPLNEGRLPYYHRLDISLKKTIVVGKNSDLEITGSLINVYNRANVFYVDRITNERVDQLPILPAIGANLTF